MRLSLRFMGMLTARHVRSEKVLFRASATGVPPVTSHGQTSHRRATIRGSETETGAMEPRYPAGMSESPEERGLEEALVTLQPPSVPGAAGQREKAGVPAASFAGCAGECWASACGGRLTIALA